MTIVRRVEKSDFSELTHVIRTVLGKEMSQEYWQWKYFSNPHGKSLSVVAVSNGKIVGLLGAVPVKFALNGDEVKAVQELDWAILDTYRELGLLLKMIHIARELMQTEDISIAYGISIPDTAELSCNLFGKIKITRAPRLAKIFNVTPFLKIALPDILTGCIFPIVNMAIKARYLRKPKIPPHVKISELETFDSRFDVFGNQIKQYYPIMIKRDSGYLNWRYRDCPDQKYRIFCAELKESGEVMGYIVLGNQQREQHIAGQILDFLTINNTIDEPLLDYALQIFHNSNVAVAWCWMFEHCHQFTELHKRGFKKRRKEQDLLFQNVGIGDSSLPKGDDFFQDISNWYLAIGDCD